MLNHAAGCAGDGVSSANTRLESNELASRNVAIANDLLFMVNMLLRWFVEPICSPI